MTAIPILKVQQLTKSYTTGAGQLTVLKSISFELPQGSTCAILGPSGSGKTTLLGLCAGLDRPDLRLCVIEWGAAGRSQRR
jgi:putative ABC transport system ATP-binding protein